MINHDIIKAIAAASQSLPRSIIAAFQDSTAEEMAKLRAAVEAGATGLVSLHSHRICGASEMVGAASVAHASRSLHAAAATGKIPPIRSALLRLEEAVGQLNQHLEGLDGA
jgi:HPt (histidine-containing phosphotransfer) domain-containing protein